MFVWVSKTVKVKENLLPQKNIATKERVCMWLQINRCNELIGPLMQQYLVYHKGYRYSVFHFFKPTNF